MILNPLSDSKLRKLKSGNFSVPRFDHSYDLELADTPRLEGSIRGMMTLMRNHGFAEIVDTFDGLPGETVHEKMPALQHLIANEIKSSPVGREEEGVTRIFHLIQLWGGREGRYIYVKNGGFKKNFNAVAYRDLIRVAISEAELLQAVEAVRQISNFGISFATKHIRFWNLFAGNGDLAIYDKIMAQGVMGISHPDWKDYPNYLEAMNRAAEKQEITVNQLERFCFAFFDSEKGKQWIKVRSQSW
jgi:hypothetical protein